MSPLHLKHFPYREIIYISNVLINIENINNHIENICLINKITLNIFAIENRTKVWNQDSDNIKSYKT